MHPSLLLIAIVALPISAMAQSESGPGYFRPYQEGATAVDTPVTAHQGIEGMVVVKADPKVERLMEQFAAQKHPQPGYRVQVFLGDRKTAEETKRLFLQKNPDTPAYLSWLAPNWRLRVGDLRTRLEAERLLRDLRAAYPGSYIVPDEIEMPALPPGH